MMYTYKINLWRQFKPLYPTFIPLLILGYCFYHNLDDWRMAKVYLILWGVCFVVDTIPAMLVHIPYYFRNRRSILEVDTEGRRLRCYNADTDASYAFSEIADLTYFRPFDEGRRPPLTFKGYRYYKIVFADGSEWIITRLMLDDPDMLEVHLRLKAEVCKKLICRI